MGTLNEASIRVTLQTAPFQSGLRRMATQTQAAGRRMGAALHKPLSVGLRSAKREFGNMMSTVKRGIGTIATLGGALAFGSLIKDGIKLQNTYRNIAFNVNKVAGNAIKWTDVQKMVTESVLKTGRSAQELSAAFLQVFEATGDLELSSKILDIVGNTATATGTSTEALGNIMQIASRKFGVGTDGMEEAMARFIEKTGVGGASAEEMGNRFGLMAGDAAKAGLTGAEGISQLLGVMLMLDSTVGEKVSPALKMVFETLTVGTTQFVRIQKAMSKGLKLNADMTAFEKMRNILSSKKGTIEAKAIFTGDARKVFDEFEKPFKKAVKEAKALGLTKTGQTKAGLKAFDESIKNLSGSTMKYSSILDEATKRQETDPLVKFNKALTRLAEAFVQPKMIAAFDKLADKMPAFADTLADIITTIVDNPWESLAAIVGGKLALAFGGSLISNVVATGMAKIFAGAVGVQAASTAASVATGGATKLGVGGGIGALAASGKLAGAKALAGTAGALTLAAGAGVGVGLLAGKALDIEGQQTRESEAIRGAGGAIAAASTVGGKSGEERINQALQDLASSKAMMENAALGGGFRVLGAAASAVTGQKSPEQLREAQRKEIEAETTRLTAALMRIANAADGAAKGLNGVEKSSGGMTSDGSRGTPSVSQKDGAAAVAG